MFSIHRTVLSPINIHTFIMHMMFSYAVYVDFMFFVLCTSIEMTAYSMTMPYIYR